MGDDEFEDILNQIIELAYLLEWGTAGVQSSDGELIGMYIGRPEWLNKKIGKIPPTPPH